MRLAAAAAAMGAIFLAIYLPDIGHGFISDDFRWVVESRVDGPGELGTSLGRNTGGFYRPIAAITFAADHAVWGADAFGYALTNLALLFACAGLLFVVARQLTLPARAALLAVGVWLFNFHAVNMALLWISGRTALLVCLFSLLTAALFLRGRFQAAGMACLAALLSKEEAVALPALFTAFDQWRFAPMDRVVRSRAAARTWPLWLALVIYVAIRVRSGAFWPADAPSYYAFTLSPALIARNVLEYADRAGTVAAAVSLLLFVFARLRGRDLDPRERLVIAFGALWIGAAYALTVFLPVRSSLYALLPSIGSALVATAIASAALRARPIAAHRVVLALLVVVAALLPVYRSRNVRWVMLAEASERVMTGVVGAVKDRAAGGHIVLVDAPGERVNLNAAFGALFPEALKLRLGNSWTGEIVTIAPQQQKPETLVFQLSRGSLVRRRVEAHRGSIE